MHTKQFIWPPSYQLRHSRRVRRVNLQFSPVKGLEIVVPVRFNLKRIPEILTEHRDWIERTQQRFKHVVPQPVETILPEMIHLPAIHQAWHIDYQMTAASVLHLKPIAENRLMLMGCVQDQIAVKKLLHQWLSRLARQYLIPQLKMLSEIHHLPFEKVSIRHSRTLWGSCNAKKNISLSSQLLFVKPELVDYVLLHELCHTKVLNHSEKFWQLLKTVNPDCHTLRKQLREAQLHLPHWLVFG